MSMKKLALLFILFAICIVIHAQSTEEGPLGRNGQWTIEVGNGFISNIGGNATGGAIIFGNGSTLTNIGINAGKFVSDRLAMKFNLGMLSIGTGFGNQEVYTIMGGFKYYIADVVPFEFSAGVLTGGGTAFLGRATVGYAIALADNINFEPSIGALFSEEDVSGVLQFSFALFF